MIWSNFTSHLSSEFDFVFGFLRSKTKFFLVQMVFVFSRHFQSICNDSTDKQPNHIDCFHFLRRFGLYFNCYFDFCFELFVDLTFSIYFQTLILANARHWFHGVDCFDIKLTWNFKSVSLFIVWGIGQQ